MKHTFTILLMIASIGISKAQQKGKSNCILLETTQQLNIDEIALHFAKQGIFPKECSKNIYHSDWHNVGGNSNLKLQLNIVIYQEKDKMIIQCFGTVDQMGAGKYRAVFKGQNGSGAMRTWTAFHNLILSLPHDKYQYKTITAKTKS